MSRRHFGSIRQLDNERYQVRWNESGKPKSKVIRGSQHDAELFLAEIEFKCTSNSRPAFPCEHTESRGMTLREFWHGEYLPYAEKLLAEQTLAGYESVWRCHLDGLFGDCELISLRPKAIERGILSIPYPGSQKAAKKLLRRVLSKAVDWERLEINPAAHRIDYERLERHTPRLYTLEEQKALISQFRASEFKREANVLLGLFGGLRREEHCALFWQDLDFAEKDGNVVCIVNITKTWQRVKILSPKPHYELVQANTKTQASKRKVILTHYPAMRLRELREGTDSVSVSGDVFRSANDSRDPRPDPLNVARDWKRYCEIHELKHVPFRDLRNTYATTQRLLGTDSATISQMLGHTNLNTAYRHYLIANMPEFIKAANKYEALDLGSFH